MVNNAIENKAFSGQNGDSDQKFVFIIISRGLVMVRVRF